VLVLGQGFAKGKAKGKRELNSIRNGGRGTSDSTPGEDMADKPSTTKLGIVQKIIKPFMPGTPEKAEIAVEEADDLYKEIRIENRLTDENGEEVALQRGAQVELTIEADPKDTVPKV
jgi:hypothetical protein